MQPIVLSIAMVLVAASTRPAAVAVVQGVPRTDGDRVLMGSGVVQKTPTASPQ